MYTRYGEKRISIKRRNFRGGWLWIASAVENSIDLQKNWLPDADFS